MSKLFYDSSSCWDWNKALPIGNGKLGAMIYGEGTSEHLQLNEETVWFGKKRNRNNKEALSHLSEIRQLILDGKIPEAEQLAKYAFSGTPQSQHTYQTLGDAFFDYCGKIKDGTNFCRSLDLETAIHSTTVTDKQTDLRYDCEAFVSAKYNCIVVHYQASQKGELSLAASLQRGNFYESTEHTSDSLFIQGNLGGGGMDFCCGLKMLSDSNQVKAMGEHVFTEQATNATIFITAATTFRYETPKTEVAKWLDAIAQVPYETIKAEHIEEYQRYFHLFRLSLDYDKTLDSLTTDARLARIDDTHPDNGLINTYMDFGRYLLISSSRGDCLPANLQGIWNRDIDAPWGSKYTININAEMNYWPAGICNLSDCEQPLFEHLLRMVPNGTLTAKEMYGCNGFVAHHNTDLWGDTAPQDIYIPATYWVLGGAWLCTHIWNHYLYEKDFDFLKRMYPTMKQAVTFFMDFLIKVDNQYVTCPSVSPENTYIMEDGTSGCLTYGATMDNEILHELFADCMKAASEVNDDDSAFFDQLKEIKDHLPPIQIGKHGQIMEWIKDYDEAEPGHRHISHLWALHPAHQITPDETPELCKAASVTLERRLSSGGGHTGWSRAWIMNMYARLWNNEKAYENLIQLFKKSTLPNLFDNHPPFQIDGNFGSIAAIGEMLLQSNENRTILLPALPSEWANGSVTGICGMDGGVYNLTWEAGVLTKASVYARRSMNTTLIYGDQRQQVILDAHTTKELL
ncbi:MAG: glycoside hydrolase family 95 protein [Eubacteriales bacterium]|nr:glycoside hydrolase family 95 protein [Eubacteriales bacterium]